MFNILGNIISDSPYDPAVRITGIPAVLTIAMNLIMAIGISISTVVMGYSAILYILSRGDPKQTSKAWNTALWSVIALAISIGAFALKQIAAATVGVVEPQITNAIPDF